jgi:hypothetical protein
MNESMKLCLLAAIFVAANGCSSTDSPGSGTGGDTKTDASTTDSAVSTGDDDDSSAPAADSSAGSCKVDSTGVATCDACRQSKCCDKIVACTSSKECAAMILCTNNCVDGKTADGGTFDAEANDGGDVDTCWNDCEAAGSDATQTIFEAQDTCVSTDCASTCL